ncbi:hypothetical protein B4135_4052 [Caldibacillus debilis]|uniref:Uncharacterized protein n=1 Tax=Caldibacillus debilis TaxID=301148 RepID=A0A150L7P4_9BACI|nr:hypothetical protein B4135_4052 [Caldibacillus debilis]
MREDLRTDGPPQLKGILAAIRKRDRRRTMADWDRILDISRTMRDTGSEMKSKNLCKKKRVQSGSIPGRLCSWDMEREFTQT